jgi:hypothetical protein
MERMSMYVDILSSALDGWIDGLAGGELIDYALVCRAEMLSSGPHHGDSAYAVLSAEIAYDRALICLCTERAISVVATSFAYPTAERARLERELASVGVDLAELAHDRPDI